MATHRRYTRKEKAEAVAEAAMTSAEAAAEKTGIPRRTIGYWMDQPEFAELRLKTGDQVADAMWVVIQQGVRRIAELIPRTDDLGKVGVAVGILYDKRALLTGAATGRTEHRDLSGSLSDNDVLGAIQAASDLTSGSRSRTEAEAPNPTEG
jgi:hypothetical protein